MGVKRFAPMLVLASSLAALSPPATASADSDMVVFDAFFGGTTSKFQGRRIWRPTLWLDGSWGAVGPLHIGGYFQWLGESWPLEDPGLGGGGMIALRPNFKKLRVTGAFTGGYLRIPLPTHTTGAGNIGALVGLGYGFLSWMGIEARGRWTRYFRMPEEASENAWSIELGLNFFVN